ncbi:hypothetical protein [Nonomuraea phyllanthi]|uniref:hypothetical protein n=1 Tax=Nonomuraea phyllanthi TaxID=2219224 RepID=UPI00186B13F6|nr:hypothetical protein [Nonomuraea phyllanthi]
MKAKTEAEFTEDGVDLHHWGATEDDEEQVLQALYGPADEDGVYRGAGDEEGE